MGSCAVVVRAFKTGQLPLLCCHDVVAPIPHSSLHGTLTSDRDSSSGNPRFIVTPIPLTIAMSVSRLSARTLRALATQQTRSMHQSGATTFSSLLTSDKPVGGQSYAPRMPASAVVPDTTETAAKARHFNTSRSLKTVKDSSTVDFTYIPEHIPEFHPEPAKLRVPVLPWAEPSAAMKQDFTEQEEPVMLPQIHTVAADGTHIHAPSAISNMTDSNQIDYKGMVEQATSTVAEPIEQGSGMFKQIWTDMVDDILGPKGNSIAKA